MNEVPNQAPDCTRSNFKEIRIKYTHLLTNELKMEDGSYGEIESKLKLNRHLSIDPIAVIFKHYQLEQKLFTLWQPEIFATTDKVFMYDTPMGGFSISYRTDDNTIRLKKKINKKSLIKNGSITFKQEHVLDIELSDGDPLEIAGKYFGINMNDIVCTGSLIREKVRMNVVHKKSRRIYTVNADYVTTDNTCNEKSFEQIEIKYKGIPTELINSDNANCEELKNQIFEEVLSLREEIIAICHNFGILLSPTKQTKRDWIKKISKQLS